MHELEGKFEPQTFEEKIYKNWNEKGYFKPSDDKTKKPYTIVIPPPNITGKLHMGHALDETLQDILIRYKRMQGFNTLWVPGTDHASIATEAKIVEKLKAEGITKEDLGREGFLKRAWEWKEEYGGTILNQLKKLGCSCDWSRERFTMDEGLSNAVTEVFIDLYNKGLIYKGKRMINWCPYCNTSISDAEVEYEEEPTHLWHVKYPVKGEEGKFVIVATTRPETMLGDTGIAVHPDDERYKDLVGKTVILPIMNKEIPIIADDFVEKEFGTGAVKLTPAHDPNDYQAALKHNLEIIPVFDEEFKMNNLVPEYKGMDMYEAREKIVERLQKEGYLVKIEDYNHNVGKCYRCHHIIEPHISEQWFVKMEPLAKPAIEAVRTGKVEFVPERFDKIYYNWMENIQDWCISRQLWWGHRIPAYYCQECGEVIVSKEEPHKCTKCGSTNLKQDEDTLDTWFSSALWPFSTLGWPDKTEDLDYFYPTNVLVTGYDIIFFWVIRMVFSGYEQTGKCPFSDVLIHGLVRDEQGRKMSKSLGNGIDPLEIIDQYGADALRLTLVTGNAPGNDMRYSEKKIIASRNFANKVWNASRFMLMNIEKADLSNVSLDDLTPADKWILSKANSLVKEVTDNMENYDFGVAVSKLNDFIWEEFCDWYIEMVKPRLYNEEDTTKAAALFTLKKVLTISLKLLHPYMPFITEEIFCSLQDEEESIMVSDWPVFEEAFDFKAEENEVEIIKNAVRNIRNLRADMNVPPSKKASVYVVSEKEEVRKVFEDSRVFFATLGYASEVHVQADKAGIADDAVSTVIPDAVIYMPFAELVDVEKEIARLEKEAKRLEGEIKRAKGMLSNEKFISKAPAAKVEAEKEKLEKYTSMAAQVAERLSQLKK